MAKLLSRLTGIEGDARIWLVVLAGFAALSVSFSARASIGLVMPMLEAEFGASRSLVSLAAALGLTVMGVLSVFSGFLADRFGAPRVLSFGLALLTACLLLMAAARSVFEIIAVYSLIGGVAAGTVAIQVVAAMVTRAVEKGRGFATGLATSGSTAGQVLIIPGLAALMAATGWRTGFVALAAVVALLGLFVWGALRGQAAPSPVAAPPPLRSLLQRDSFVFAFPFQALFWSYVICGFTTSGVIETHLLPYAIACGFTPLEGASAYGLLSVINLVGIIFAGWLSDRLEKHWLLAAIYTLRALGFLLLMRVASDLDALLAFTIVFGMADYATIPVTIGLLARHIGVSRIGTSMGLLAGGHAIGGAIGALAGGVLYDLFASYAATWWASAALAQVAALLVLSVLWNARSRPAVAQA